MQKVYLLLRSNKQSGPYTKDELLELNLKPLDLVWIEGKSYGWSYPSEIDSLKAFVEAPAEEKSQTPTEFKQNVEANIKVSSPASNKKIYVSMPVKGDNASSLTSNTSYNLFEQRSEEVKTNKQNVLSSEEPEYDHQALERKAEELRQMAQSYASSKPINNQEDLVEIKYAKTLEEVEKDYTSWMYANKTRKKKYISKEQLVSALAVVVVIAGGWFIGSGLFNKETKEADQVVHVQNAVKEEISPVISETPEDEPMRYDIAESKNMDNPTVVSKPEQEKKFLTEKTGIEKTEKNVAIATIEDYKLPEPVEEPISTTKEEPVAEVEQPKKRTLGESVSNVFRKLIKNEEADTKPEPANGERKSNRKGEVSTAESDISDQVEVRMSKNSENWMMGVIGLKITLSNKSSIPLKTAVIEVLYYNDQDKLLDKKRITFSSIAPKKSQTISAPDHRLADHAEIKIVSATGIEDAYAKN